ncbi:MAG: hypothetical protein P1V97_30325 [Planctomycetota bacterium]|nr:hypothetical protein [Planctomycetota bacterium]
MQKRNSQLFSVLGAAFLALLPLSGASGETQQYRLLDALAPFYNPDKAPPNSWAMPFSHMDIDKAPYVDELHMKASVKRFDEYCAHAARRGYTAVIVGNLIHLVNFDRISSEGPPIYSQDSPYRARHERYQFYYKQVAASAHKHGLKLVIETDFPAWTPPLKQWLGPEGLTLKNPRLWIAYKAALEELIFDLGADLISVRIGEGGGAYNEKTGYSSAVLTRTIQDTQEVLEQLLSIVESINETKKNGRMKLLFRTWTIGIGEIGALHTNPGLYEKVFSKFYGRKDLITVMKHVAMDFFAYIPPNPTIGIGEIPQIVELEARREYEGFHLFPNYRGEEVKRHLQLFSKTKSFAGISVWPTNGGFLMNSPTIYRNQGNDDWIDMNVHAFSRLAQDSSLDPGALIEEWGAEKKLSPSDQTLLSELMLRSDDIVDRGFYIAPFAHKPLPLFGLDYFPTLLWVYWTRPGTSYAVQSLIYRGCADSIDEAIKDGEDSIKDLEEQINRAESLQDKAFRIKILEALNYQLSYYVVLGEYRKVFLNQYRWSMTGDSASYDAWQAALPALTKAAAQHRRDYQGNRFLPPWDLREIDRELIDDQRIPSLRWLAFFLALALSMIGAVALAPIISPQSSMANKVSRPLPTIVRAVLGAMILGIAGVTLINGQGVVVVFLGLFSTSLIFHGIAWKLLSLLQGPEKNSQWHGALLGLQAPWFFLVAVLCFGYGLRGPACLHALYIYSFFGSWPLALFLSLIIVPGLACLGLHGVLASRVLGGKAVAILRFLFLYGLLSGALLIGGLGLIGVKGLLKFNQYARIAPSILNEAGTDVDDFLPE